MQETFRTGCLFWPRRKGPWFLASEALWDRGEVRDELAHLADVGFGVARVALPWEALQPAPERLRAAVLDRVAQLLDAAEAARLGVQVTLAGQLGGTLFAPSWLLAHDPEAPQLRPAARMVQNGWEAQLPLGDLYEAAALRAAQRYGWTEFARIFAAHPALWELDLGAGGLLGAVPPRGAEAALGWWAALVEGVQEVAPTLRLSYSDDLSLLLRDGLPRLAAWREAVGRLSLWTSPVSSSLAQGDLATAWPLFLLTLARTLAGGPVGCASLGEVTSGGIPTPLLRPSEGEQARYFGEVLPALHALGVSWICHALWADAPPALAETPPLDKSVALRHAGLLRNDGTEKEAARIWRAFHQGLDPATWGRAARTLTLDEDEWSRRRREPGWVEALFRRFREGEV